MTTANHALHLPLRFQIYNGIEMTVERAQALEESRQQTVIRKRGVALASRSFAIVIHPKWRGVVVELCQQVKAMKFFGHRSPKSSLRNGSS